MKDFKISLIENTGLENIVEDIVISELYKYYLQYSDTANPKFCICWICLADVAAIILNNTKPFYYTNFIDKEKKSYELGYLKNLRDEIHLRITEAFDIVKKNPHH